MNQTMQRGTFGAASPKQIGDYNKNQMLSLLREKGPTSRVELSRLLGISSVAVSRSTSRLLKNNIISECEAESSYMGRKPIPVELRGDFCYVLGADVVGGTLKVALADLMGKIVEYHEEPIKNNHGAQTVIKQLLGSLQNIIIQSEVPKEKIWFATIGTPGIFYPEEGKSRFAFFLKGWEDIDIRSLVFDALSIETLIDNDVNLDLIAESWKGEGKDYENILYVKLGQGLASRILLDNKLIRGEHNMAGEIGLMLPGLSSLDTENYESLLHNTAICDAYRAAGGTSPVLTISDLCRLAGNGDNIAHKIMERMLEKFAVVLINSAAVLDPQVIILGGDASSFGELEINFLKKKIEPHLPQIQNIITSKLDKKGCLYGAIKTGLDRIEERICDIW